MLDGWYCRTIKNQNSTEQNEQDDEQEPNVVDDSEESQDMPSHTMPRPRVDYKIQYYTLKKKLKFLLYVSRDWKIIRFVQLFVFLPKANPHFIP